VHVATICDAMRCVATQLFQAKKREVYENLHEGNNKQYRSGSTEETVGSQDKDLKITYR
jgi:hypothetical protein